MKRVWAIVILVLVALPAQAASAFRQATTPNPSGSGNDLSDVAAISSTDVWSVGTDEGDNTIPSKTLAEHWNGTGWSIVRTPNAGPGWNFLSGVSGSSSTDVWAVGRFVRGSVSGLVFSSLPPVVPWLGVLPWLFLTWDVLSVPFGGSGTG